MRGVILAENVPLHRFVVTLDIWACPEEYIRSNREKRTERPM